MSAPVTSIRGLSPKVRAALTWANANGIPQSQLLDAAMDALFCHLADEHKLDDDLRRAFQVKKQQGLLEHQDFGEQFDDAEADLDLSQQQRQTMDMYKKMMETGQGLSEEEIAVFDARKQRREAERKRFLADNRKYLAQCRALGIDPGNHAHAALIAAVG